MNHIDKIIQHVNMNWRVVATGATSEGKTFCHLAHLYKMQRDGKTPIQINDWVSEKTLSSYFTS